ncbi:hypothetical protein BMETH_31081110529, partial [methanotrophic bacterial endosymbiont of Bathymodiolus sp.]
STLCFLESVVSHLIWEKEIPEEKIERKTRQHGIAQ